jgi:hypothetical protein
MTAALPFLAETSIAVDPRKTEEQIQRDFGSLDSRDPRSQITELRVQMRADRFDRDCAILLSRRGSFASDVINASSCAPQRDCINVITRFRRICVALIATSRCNLSGDLVYARFNQML